MIAYKFLRGDGSSVFTDFRWPLPDGAPGAWVDAPVDPCRSGVHACRPAGLPYWIGRSLYEVELAGDIVEEPTKVVASRARLLRPITAWNDSVRDDYTRMCADRAHELAFGASPPLEQWDAVIEPSVPEGPALLGFVAARIAEKRQGTAAYHDERGRQTAWLVERLGLQDAAPS
jgi:hypothetical protein